jgi:hypothetical protein
MIKKFRVLALFFFLFQTSYAQYVQLSVYSEVSIITVGPGNELFEAFGHSAFRIKDPMLQIDLVYNYGMFDFNAPHFYLNFVKGDLLYQLARYPFPTFVSSNQRDKRWMKAQILNLTQEQKQQYFEFLESNARPVNAAYLYDPYFDNCASKLRDVTKTILGDKIIFDNTYAKEDLSLRELMNKEIPWNTWGSFGINLALGSRLDKLATPNEYMYLPDYIYAAFKGGTVFKENQKEALIRKEETVLIFKEKLPKNSLLNPFTVFSIISFLGIVISYRDVKRQKRTKWIDTSIFLLTGSIGILIIFLWFFTHHSTAPNNYNILWCFPFNLVVGLLLMINEPKKWIKEYLFLLLLFLFLIPVVWFFRIQLFPKVAIPILLLLFVRYYVLTRLLTFKK